MRPVGQGRRSRVDAGEQNMTPKDPHSLPNWFGLGVTRPGAQNFLHLSVLGGSYVGTSPPPWVPWSSSTSQESLFCFEFCFVLAPHWRCLWLLLVFVLRGSGGAGDLVVVPHVLILSSSLLGPSPPSPKSHFHVITW